MELYRAAAIAHAPLLLYLLAIVALFALTLPGKRFSAISVLFVLIAAGSFYWTWTHMLQYAERSFIEGQSNLAPDSRSDVILSCSPRQHPAHSLQHHALAPVHLALRRGVVSRLY